MRRGRGAVARSKTIDHQIDAEREKKSREIQVLILGGASSGKSTFIKQLRIHQGDGFPECDRIKHKCQIFQNVADALNVVMDNMSLLNMDYSSSANKVFGKTLSSRFPRHINYPQDSAQTTCMLGGATGGVYDTNAHPGTKLVDGLGQNVTDYTQNIRQLWQDEGFQEGYRHQQEFHHKLVEGELYFLQNMDRILQPHYVPSLQDVLYIRKPTLGVTEHTFTSHGLNYRVIDVAGQKSQRKKWISFFDKVTAVTFFAALNGYCQNLEEDNSINCLHDSLQTFHEVTHNRFLDKTAFVLFLNKRDLFEECMKHHKLTECFPDYNGEHTLDAATHHIRQEFLNRSPNKNIYCHITCAVNMDMMKKIIENVMEIIVEINLRKAASPL